MSISNTNRKAGPFTGNGTASSFPFYFKVFEAADLQVVRLDVGTSLETVLAITADYTVTLNANQDATPGGSVVLVAGALASGYLLTITSAIGNLQPTNLTNQGGFYPDVIEDALDRATIQIQQMSETLDRAVTIPISSTASTQLPYPQGGTVIGWDDTGTSLVNLSPEDIASQQLYANWKYDTFAGDGTTTQFTLQSNPGNIANMDVSVSGVTQLPGTDYTLSGTTIAFTTAPGLDLSILVRYGQATVQTNVTYSQEVFNVTSGTVDGTGKQTIFNLTSSYSPGNNGISVYLNGSRLVGGVDYTETTSTRITLAKGAFPGDVILVITAEPINANVSDAAQVSYTPAGIDAVSTNVQSKLRETVSVLDFGAYGDGSHDDTSAIQAAIDYAGSLNKPTEVIIPSGKTYIISVGTRTGIADGVAGLVMRDYVTLIINGTLFAKADLYGPGALSALIKSPDVGNSGITIKGTGIVDGNRSNQLSSAQCDNIYLRAVYQVKVEGIKSINCNGNGIMIVKAVGGANHVDVSIINTIVAGSNNIGIQVSHSAANLVISGNEVTSCTNNCIDVYNENGTITPDPGIITISNNTVAGGLAGIFPETTQNCSVIGNSIGSCTTGIITNRINGAPTSIVISGNSIYNCPTGIMGSGDTNGVLICTNTIYAFTSSGVYLNGQTLSSYVVHGNMFNPSTTTTPIILLNGTTFVWNQIFNNVCVDASHNSAYGIVLASGTLGANTLEPIIYSPQVRPVKISNSGNTVSGGTLTIATPAYTSGKLVIKSSAGGAWETVWSGSFAAGASRVSIAQESTIFTAPGNGIASVAGNVSSLNITVTWASSGSTGAYNYWIEYI